MRRIVCVLMTAAMWQLSVGCASPEPGESREASFAQSANDGGGGQACVMQSDGRDVLRFMPPAGATCIPKIGFFRVYSREERVDVWMVGGVSTVDEAVARVAEVIESEFEDFEAETATDRMIAGAAAKLLAGSGTEADDGDPGYAYVFVFKTGGHVFVACTHGEHLTMADQQWMLDLVHTARRP